MAADPVQGELFFRLSLIRYLPILHMHVFYTLIIFYINKILLFLFVFFIIKNIIKPYVLMVALQFGSVGMYIISMATLNHGMSRFVLIVYRNAVAALTMAPFALLLERLIRNPFPYIRHTCMIRL